MVDIFYKSFIFLLNFMVNYYAAELQEKQLFSIDFFTCTCGIIALSILLARE